MDNIQIKPYSEHYLPEIVKLFTIQYKHLLSRLPMMPHRYLDYRLNHEMIKWLFDNYEGVLAFREDRLVGYLSGLIVPRLRSSQTGIYTPEWGHAVIDKDHRLIYDKMLNTISSIWAESNYAVHAMAFLSMDQADINQLFWAGYGMFTIDGIKMVTQSDYKGEQIRKANVYDWDGLVELVEENNAFLAKHPTYIFTNLNKSIEELEEDLGNPNVHIWVIEENKELVAMMKTMEDSKESCTIVRDRKTLCIGSTYVKESHRNKGLEEAILNKVNTWAFEQKFERIAINFEATNSNARYFWLNHFKPVCYSLIRYLDDRMIPKKTSSFN